MEALPGPKISTIKEATEKVLGAAPINLSGSEKIEKSASRSHCPGQRVTGEWYAASPTRD